MPRPDFNIGTLAHIVSKLEDQGKEVQAFSHHKDDSFKVEVKDPSHKPSQYTGIYTLRDEKVVCVEILS
jgi:hypothetical protein